MCAVAVGVAGSDNKVPRQLADTSQWLMSKRPMLEDDGDKTTVQRSHESTLVRRARAAAIAAAVELRVVAVGSVRELHVTLVSSRAADDAMTAGKRLVLTFTPQLAAATSSRRHQPPPPTTDCDRRSSKRDEALIPKAALVHSIQPYMMQCKLRDLR